MLTREQIKDATWTHGDHCECERCDRRRGVMLDALAAYERVAALLQELDVRACHGDPPPCHACQDVAVELRRALEG
jgi:hypothetical protein